MPLPTAMCSEREDSFVKTNGVCHRSLKRAILPHQRNGPYFGGLVLGGRHLRSAHHIPFITFETPFAMAG